MKKFIFDVDGTLTPSRGTIDSEFKEFFNQFCRNNQVFLVTGSDKTKTIEQLGEDTYNLAHTVYNCNGNEAWQGKKNCWGSIWLLPESAHIWLSKQLTLSDFPVRAGNHFEHRPGMVNFSVVGRNATYEQRQHYVKWDKERDERKNIASMFRNNFPEIDAQIGGETGIDIFPYGKDKSQILSHFDEDSELIFFGDAIYEGGNDYTLAKSIVDQNIGKYYNIQNWQNTWELLKEYDN